jgi:hypothetical protein
MTTIALLFVIVIIPFLIGLAATGVQNLRDRRK